MKKSVILFAVSQLILVGLMIYSNNPIFTGLFILTVTVYCIYISRTSKSFGDWIETKEISLPKQLNWIGGFVTTLLPSVAFTNKTRRMARKVAPKSINYHEKMHLEWLFKEGGILIFFLIVTITTALIGYFGLSLLIMPIVMSLFLTSTEIITNNRLKTRYNLNLEPSTEPRWEYYLRYVTLYFTYSLLILLIGGYFNV
jgi:hypothetical protein